MQTNPEVGTLIIIEEWTIPGKLLVLNSRRLPMGAFMVTLLLEEGQIIENLYFEKRKPRETPGDPYDCEPYWNLHWKQVELL
jgi:hypothetical protein